MMGPFDWPRHEPKRKQYKCKTCHGRYDTAKARTEHFAESGHNEFYNYGGTEPDKLASKKAVKREKSINEAENRYRASLPRTEHEERTGSYAPFSTKTEAKHSLGMGGGAYEPRASHPFGRWLQKREKRKETLLTVPVEPKEPKPEKSRNRLAEDMADQELEQTRKEARGRVTSGTIVPETPESLREDSRNHLIFRRHSYLPTLGVHLPVGAYGKSPHKGGGLSNMANDPNTRN